MVKLFRILSEHAEVDYMPYQGENIQLHLNGHGTFASFHFQNYKPEWEKVRELGEILITLAESHMKKEE